MKKTQTNQNPPLPTSMDLASKLEEHPIVQWFAENGKSLLYVLGAGILLFILGYKLANGASNQSEMDYVQAQNEFNRFQTSEERDAQEDSFQKLVAVMDRHPELHAKYDGLIAQTLLNRSQTADAKKFASSALERTKSENEPFYTDFAQTTLLIAEEKYADALQRAQALQQKMLPLVSQEKNYGGLLYADNLVRIGMLQQQLGDKKGELQTWQEWKKLAGLSKESAGSQVDPLNFRAIDSLYSEGKISFLQYIEFREKSLKS
jgi:hypothetical protein